MLERHTEEGQETSTPGPVPCLLLLDGLRVLVNRTVSDIHEHRYGHRPGEYRNGHRSGVVTVHYRRHCVLQRTSGDLWVERRKAIQQQREPDGRLDMVKVEWEDPSHEGPSEVRTSFVRFGEQLLVMGRQWVEIIRVSYDAGRVTLHTASDGLYTLTPDQFWWLVQNAEDIPQDDTDVRAQAGAYAAQLLDLRQFVRVQVPPHACGDILARTGDLHTYRPPAPEEDPS